MELRGKQIHKGDRVAFWIRSGNRDEEAFVNPYAFDIRRTPNEHIGLGRYHDIHRTPRMVVPVRATDCRHIAILFLQPLVATRLG
jgi:hypothetical protein